MFHTGSSRTYFFSRRQEKPLPKWWLSESAGSESRGGRPAGVALRSRTCHSPDDKQKCIFGRGDYVVTGHRFANGGSTGCCSSYGITEAMRRLKSERLRDGESCSLLSSNNFAEHIQQL
jgi:hypothetical protein